MISKKDKLILNFIYEHGSISIQQCAKVIFKRNKYAYDQARKQLRQLYKEKAISCYKPPKASEKLYYIDSPLGIHALKLIDVYAELLGLGADIKTFHKKYRIYTSNDKYREIDALMELYYDGYFIPLIVEIDYSHNTSITKLKEIYQSRHFQERYKDIDNDIFPLIVIVRPILSENIEECELPVLYLDFSLDNLVVALQ